LHKELTKDKVIYVILNLTCFIESVTKPILIKLLSGPVVHSWVDEVVRVRKLKAVFVVN
jgi:hypothetical protein